MPAAMSETTHRGASTSEPRVGWPILRLPQERIGSAANMLQRPGTTRCFGPCITPACAQTKRPSSTPRTCISDAVRSGRCTCGSAKVHAPLARGRDGYRCSTRLDLVLRWYLDDVRPKLPGIGGVVLRSERWRHWLPGTIRNRLRYLHGIETMPAVGAFQPARDAACLRDPQLRTRSRSRCDPAAFGHWTVGSTMRYVRPSETFIEDAYRARCPTPVSILQGDR